MCNILLPLELLQVTRLLAQLVAHALSHLGHTRFADCACCDLLRILSLLAESHLPPCASKLGTSHCQAEVARRAASLLLRMPRFWLCGLTIKTLSLKTRPRILHATLSRFPCWSTPTTCQGRASLTVQNGPWHAFITPSVAIRLLLPSFPSEVVCVSHAAM